MVVKMVAVAATMLLTMVQINNYDYVVKVMSLM
jgi:hypothetical protein